MSETSNPQSLGVGDTVLWYEIESVLGQGGFGITYRARDTNLDLVVAIKEYLPSMFASRRPDGLVAPDGSEQKADYEWGLARFIDEGRTLARFDHRGIVRVHSVFEANGTAYLVMRYEQGEALDTVLKRSGTLPEEQLQGILFDVMDGLVPVHDAGFIHRDIKPANIYLRADGSAVLIDFGSARQALGVQTQTLTTLVSPGYAPFEQYASESSQQGPWTDIYALGATAYRAMTGHSPVTAVDRSRALLTSAPDRTLEALGSLENYSRVFVHAIEQAMAFHESDRPQTVSQWQNLFGEAAAAPAAKREPGPLDFDLGDDEPPTARYADADTEIIAPTEVINPSPDTENRWRNPARFAVGAAVLLLAALWWRPWHGDGAGPATARSEAAPSASDPVAGESRTAREAITPAPTIDGEITRLLEAADKHWAAGRLTRPDGNNALAMYRGILERDPFNDAAEAGIERIVQDRLARAREAIERDDAYLARAYLDEAAIADPAHRDVLLTRADLPEPSPAPVATARAPDVTPSPPAREQDRSGNLTETLLGQADKLADPKTRRQLNNARKAAQKQDYRKALKLLKRGFEGD